MRSIGSAEWRAEALRREDEAHLRTTPRGRDRIELADQLDRLAGSLQGNPQIMTEARDTMRSGDVERAGALRTVAGILRSRRSLTNADRELLARAAPYLPPEVAQRLGLQVSPGQQQPQQSAAAPGGQGGSAQPAARPVVPIAAVRDAMATNREVTATWSAPMRRRATPLIDRMEALSTKSHGDFARLTPDEFVEYQRLKGQLRAMQAAIDASRAQSSSPSSSFGGE